MIIKCPNCGGVLTFDASTGQMHCSHCHAAFDAQTIQQETPEEEMMQCNIFACTACGAQLAVNDVECATYCAYCGQPTIVFERVSKMKKPDKIIPFSITREEAEKAIRNHLSKGFFVPGALKHFEVERMVGIYVPFMVYDIHYHDRQTLRIKSGKRTRTEQREATSQFIEVPLDASKNLCNESSQRLEPYVRNSLIDFHESYLSGFYADCSDEKDSTLTSRAFQKCKLLFDNEVIRSVTGGFNYGDEVTITSSKPTRKILNSTYAMLPAWFMTTRYQDQPYTILVNGQTGKVVGAVPFTKAKVVVVFLAILAVLLTFVPTLCSALLSFALHLEDSDGLELFFGIWGFVTIGSFVTGMSLYERLKKHIQHAADKKLTNFSNKRQEDNQ